MSVSNVIFHLQNLEEIAKNHSNSRATVKGYNQSAEYVVSFLKNNTDYKVWTETVIVKDQVDHALPAFSVHQKNSSNVKIYTPNQDFITFSGSGSGSYDALPLRIVSDCNLPDHYEPFIAVLTYDSPRGETAANCTKFCDRVIHTVINLRASAIIVVSTPVNSGYSHPTAARGGRGPLCPIKTDPEAFNALISVPVLSFSQASSWDIYSRVAERNSLLGSIQVSSEYKNVHLVNVLAETLTGDPNSVVLYSGHLDSVRQGPGVNDDGSGAMGTLELAHAFYRSKLSRNTVQVRFGFWTAEEIGLLGSESYVENLFKNDPESLYKIKLNIDIDMIASPNYVRGLWDGYSVNDPVIRNSSIVIHNVFESWFHKRHLPTARFKFNGRSDFVAFMNRGIPAGGLYTGADEIKTPHEAELFGGVSGLLLDPNYHQPSDTVDSLRGPGFHILGENLKCLAHSLAVFAFKKNLTRFLQG